MANYICKLSRKIKRQQIRYNNRYGVAIAGDCIPRREWMK